MCYHTRFVDLFYHQRTVFSGKFHINTVNLGDLDLAATDGLSLHLHLGAVFSRHPDIHSIRMIRNKLLISDILIFHSHLLCPGKCIPDPQIIGCKSKHTAKQCPVCTMSFIRSCKRTIQSECHLCHFFFEKLSCHLSDRYCSRCMGAGRSHHIGADHLKRTDKIHRFLLVVFSRYKNAHDCRADHRQSQTGCKHCLYSGKIHKHTTGQTAKYPSHGT